MGAFNLYLILTISNLGRKFTLHFYFPAKFLGVMVSVQLHAHKNIHYELSKTSIIF